jgi:hypothetical protein
MTRRDWAVWVPAAAALALSFAWRPSGLPNVDVCFFHRLTGLPCPGCGLTHSFCGISHGSFAAAWACNPFGYLFYGIAVILLLRPLLGRHYEYYERLILRPRVVSVGVPALVGAMWVFGVLRMIRQIAF